MYEGTLLSLLEPRMGRKDTDIAFMFWDGRAPLWYQTKLSYGRLKNDALALAAAFQKELKILPGERMIFMLGNMPQFPIAYFAALYAGIVPVPINPLLKPQEILRLIKNSGAVTLLAVDKLYPAISEMAESSSLRKIILTGIAESLPFLKAQKYLGLEKKEREKNGLTEDKLPYGNGRIFNFSDLLSAHFHKTFSVNAAPKDIALMLYTSGTVGEPKGVLLSHGALFENAIACRKLLMFDLDIPKNKPIFLAAAPYFHIMGISALLNTALLMDAKVVLLSDKNLLQLTKKILEAASYTKAIAFVGAPMHYEAMAKVLEKNLREYNLADLKLCISGSARLSCGVRNKFERLWGGKVLEGFGQSEIGILTCQRPWKIKKGSVGRPIEGVSLQIENPDENGKGELLAKSPGIMTGYWHSEKGLDFEKTFSVIDENGRLHTGDLAKIDKDGDVFLYDRVDDIIKFSDGEKISALEIEKEILKHQQVIEVAVVKVRNKQGEDIVKAFVVLRDMEMHSISEDIIRHCRQQKLPPHKVPSEVECVKELPKNAFGKVLKKVLRASS